MRRYQQRAYKGRNRSNVINEHTLIVERILGKRLPKGAQVHHFNENGLDNRHQNLVVCPDMAYHKLLHVRQRVKAAGGNPNTERICSRCNQCLPFASFNRFRTGLQRYCRTCQSAAFSDWFRRASQ
jgi:hypothetical protein